MAKSIRALDFFSQFLDVLLVFVFVSYSVLFCILKEYAIGFLWLLCFPIQFWIIYRKNVKNAIITLPEIDNEIFSDDIDDDYEEAKIIAGKLIIFIIVTINVSLRNEYVIIEFVVVVAYLLSIILECVITFIGLHENNYTKFDYL